MNEKSIQIDEDRAKHLLCKRKKVKFITLILIVGRKD